MLTAITIVVLFYTHIALGSDGIFQNLLQIKALPLEIIGELLWAMWQETLALRKLIYSLLKSRHLVIMEGNFHILLLVGIVMGL